MCGNIFIKLLLVTSLFISVTGTWLLNIIKNNNVNINNDTFIYLNSVRSMFILCHPNKIQMLHWHVTFLPNNRLPTAALFCNILTIVIFKWGIKLTPHGRRRRGRQVQSWRNHVTDFMKCRNMEEDMAEDRHLWRLEVDGRLLAV